MRKAQKETWGRPKMCVPDARQTVPLLHWLQGQYRDQSSGYTEPGPTDLQGLSPPAPAQPAAAQTCPFVFVHKTVLELIVAEEVVYFLQRKKPEDRESLGMKGNDPGPPSVAQLCRQVSNHSTLQIMWDGTLLPIICPKPFNQHPPAEVGWHTINIWSSGKLLNLSKPLFAKCTVSNNPAVVHHQIHSGGEETEAQ